MARLNRRDFLKALGLAGATAASACGIDDNWYRTPVEEVLPYVVKPEQVTPGAPTFFATTVTSGPDAWPVTGRHRDGRVINVGANRQAPVPGAIPKAALMALQLHYAPDRIVSPQGAASWEAGLEQLASAVKKASSEGKAVAWLGGYRSGALAGLIQDFTGGNAVFWEPLGRADQADAAETLYGSRVLPRYTISGAHYVLSFGAPFLGTWGGPQVAHDFAKAKNPNEGHFIARFGLVSPHMDQTGAKADDWYACTAGAQTAAAFAIARLVADKKGYAGAASSILAGVDVAANAAAAGLSVEVLTTVADRFASAESAVAFPGATENADLAIATALINEVSGNVGKTVHMDGYAGPVHATRHVAQLVADMNAGKIGVLLLDDANPVYALPASVGFAAAMAKVGTTVALTSHPSETQAKATLTLPVGTAFEDWGDEDLGGGMHLLRQPTMTALHDGLAIGDVLLATARAAGLKAPAAPAPAEVEEAEVEAPADGEETEAAPVVATGPLGFEPKTWREYVMTRWERQIWAETDRSVPFQSFWYKSLQAGFHQGHGMDAPALSPAGYSAPAPAAATGIGLHLYAHPHRFDGRFAPASWAQETADPMTGQVWDSWLEVSKELAAELGVSDNDQVDVKTSAGSVKLGIEVYAGLKGKTAALAFGQGRSESGRYAKDRGVNAFGLVAGDAMDSLKNVLMSGGTATISKTGAKADLVSIIGADTDGGRFWGVSVNADKLAEVGDSEAAHPGELTGIHHLGRDGRLEEKGRMNFYEPPDHSTYRFAMTVDTNACDGCGACVVACAAENNLPVVGKSLIRKGREMNWLRINRYIETVTDEHGEEHLDVRYVPVMCQHCALAPCESVCPVLATYHNIDGLNAMVYNRCVGTRYCANNCPYVVRRFNFHSYSWPAPLNLQLNPDVSVRTMGVMEKCTFCVQRTRRVKDVYRDRGFTTTVPDEALRELTACAEACPSGALTFGNQKDPASAPNRTRKSARNYVILSEFNTFSAVNYLAKASFHVTEPHHGGGHGGGHGEADHADGGHGADAAHGDGGHGGEHADDHGKADNHDGAEHHEAEH